MWRYTVLVPLLLISLISSGVNAAEPTRKFLQVKADTAKERTEILSLGMSIEQVRTGSVWGFASPSVESRLKKSSHQILGTFDEKIARGGHQTAFGFPENDSRYHDYKEMIVELELLAATHSERTKLISIGKTTEGREIYALHINSDATALETGLSDKPGVIFMGQHHAREHLSREIPLMLATYLLESAKRVPELDQLLSSRDVWIIPSVNPDGAEFDLSTDHYVWWRKNRRDNGDGTFGVDLNRNYDNAWGGAGSSPDTSAETYHGTAPFSEPETVAIRDFLRKQPNSTMTLSFHTFGELLMYPWGGVEEPIANTRDRLVHEQLARTMAEWNHYEPMQSSQLYIAGGDSADWMYGELGKFSFTFELSPQDMFGEGGGGFYPGDEIIDRVFRDNLRPCLHLIEMAGNPYQVLNEGSPDGLMKSLVLPPVPQKRKLADRIADLSGY